MVHASGAWPSGRPQLDPAGRQSCLSSFKMKMSRHKERWHDLSVSDVVIAETTVRSLFVTLLQRPLASRALLRVEMDVTHSFCAVNVHSRCQMAAW